MPVLIIKKSMAQTEIDLNKQLESMTQSRTG